MASEHDVPGGEWRAPNRDSSIASRAVHPLTCNLALGRVFPGMRVRRVRCGAGISTASFHSPREEIVMKTKVMWALIALNVLLLVGLVAPFGFNRTARAQAAPAGGRPSEYMM